MNEFFIHEEKSFIFLVKQYANLLDVNLFNRYLRNHYTKRYNIKLSIDLIAHKGPYSIYKFVEFWVAVINSNPQKLHIFDIPETICGDILHSIQTPIDFIYIFHRLAPIIKQFLKISNDELIVRFINEIETFHPEKNELIYFLEEQRKDGKSSYFLEEK